MYNENHSLGEWFSKRLLSIMRTKRTPFAIIKMRSANCIKVAKGGHSKMNDVKKFITYELELQISYCVRTEIQKKSVLWTEAQRDRSNFKKAV